MEGLSGYLSEWGLDLSESELTDLVRESLEAVGGHAVADPERELPRTELELLAEGGFSTRREALGRDDPLLRGALDLSALIATALSTREAAALLGVNPSRIRQRLLGARPSLYGMKWRGEWLLPPFQLTARGEVPGLAQVVPELDRSLSPVAVAHWFLSPSPDLVPDEDGEEPVSPRDWLLAGHAPAEVARLASGL